MKGSEKRLKRESEMLDSTLPRLDLTGKWVRAETKAKTKAKTTKEGSLDLL